MAGNSGKSCRRRTKAALFFAMAPASAAFAAPIKPETSSWAGSSTNFIVLLLLLMFALTIMAMAFNRLKLSDPQEAFGLPGGSMRALLAFTVAMLLVAFAMPILNGGGPLRIASDKPFLTVQIDDPAKLKNAEELYQRQGFVTIHKSDGTPAIVAAGTNTVTTPAVPAELELYAKTTDPSPAMADLHKQILTTVLALLTSVISFYFGSRSATEGFREGNASTPPADPALTDPLKAQRTRFDKAQLAIDAMEKDIAALSEVIGHLPELPEAASEEEKAARTQAVAAHEKLTTAFKTTHDALDAIKQKLSATEALDTNGRTAGAPAIGAALDGIDAQMTDLAKAKTALGDAVKLIGGE